MEQKFHKYENYVLIFISLIGVLLFGILLYSSKSIINPIFVYVLILIFYLLNRELPVIKSIFVLSTIIFLVWFFYELLAILTPFLISFVLAYLLNPFVGFLEKKKISRTLATSITILLLLMIGVLLLSFIIPPFVEQVSLLISSAPEKIFQLTEYFNSKILPELNQIGLAYPDFQEFLSKELPVRLQSLLNSILNNILSLISSFGAIFNQIINLVIIPIMTFYFLKDFEKILDAIKNIFSSNYQEKVTVISRRVDKIFGNYIRGFLTVSIINGLVVTIGLSIIGVPYAIMLGILSALLNFIPYFGVIISFAIGFLISLLSGIGGIKLLFVPIVYFGENILENSLITPKVIGERVGLHPLLVLLAIFVFGYFAGILGMLISVPITALLISLFFERELN
ncbi:MAG: AI-2E family transporter [Ignavibacteria bacterium]|nr:AI-2E family transporter [Ignavibacteria bacterium]